MKYHNMKYFKTFSLGIVWCSYLVLSTFHRLGVVHDIIIMFVYVLGLKLLSQSSATLTPFARVFRSLLWLMIAFYTVQGIGSLNSNGWCASYCAHNTKFACVRDFYYSVYHRLYLINLEFIFDWFFTNVIIVAVYNFIYNWLRVWCFVSYLCW